MAPRTRPQTPEEYGRVSGFNDRHYMRDSFAEQACDEEPNGYQEWLAGWRTGQAERRAVDPETMTYEPLYPQKPPPGKGKRKAQTQCPKHGKRKAARAANSSRQRVARR